MGGGGPVRLRSGAAPRGRAHFRRERDHQGAPRGDPHRAAALADDSGIVVDALGGAPGVHSARYAGEGSGDAANNEKLLRTLAGVPDAERTARFECAVVWLRDPRDPVPLIARGTWTGRVLEAPRGTNGFGYDPLFLDPESGCTAAELAPARKDALSHRGQALRSLRELLAVSVV